MSETYEDDLAAEQAILDRAADAEPGQGNAEPRGDVGGRPRKVVPIKLVAWRQAHKASISATAKHWNVSEATVKRMSREYGEAAKVERKRWQVERIDADLRHAANSYWQMYNRIHSERLYWVGLTWFRQCEAAKGTDQEAATNAAKDAAITDASRVFRAEWERAMGPVPEPLPHW